MLPGNMHQALEYLKEDEVIKKAIGDFIYEKFVELKEQEWIDYAKQVTDWDWKRYFGC